MTMDIADLIAEAKRVYAAARLDCGDGLLPPSGKAAVDAIEHALSVTVPPELCELYRLHGGQRYRSPGVSGLFGEHRLLSPDEAIDHHRIYSQTCLLDPRPAFPPAEGEAGYWVPELIPFASWDAYDLCIHARRTDVWEFLPSSGLIRHFPNIATVLQTAISAVAAGQEPTLGPMRGRA